jgi:hypothetical protein
MNVKRIAAIGAVGGALAVWLAAASTMITQPVVVDTSERKTTAVELRGAALAAEITRLRERLRPTSAPQLPSRNLFEFSRTAPVRAAPSVPPILPEAEAPRPAPPPPLRLVGMAEDAGSDGPVRTAIISGFGQLFMVKEGERVTARYQVAKISGEVAEIRDLGDNSTITLVLK